MIWSIQVKSQMLMPERGCVQLAVYNKYFSSLMLLTHRIEMHVFTFY